MQEYYFLFVLALIWTFAAAIQDLKKREVANWLNFSLIVFAFAYRAFYSIENKNPQFFIYGLIGFVIFLAFGYACYYGKVFAGGDAKLLMGIGIIMPYENFSDFIILPIVFMFVLFLFGSLYSLIYSIGIVIKNKNKFSKEFTKKFRKNKYSISTASISAIVVPLIFHNPIAISSSILLLIPLLYVYTKSLEVCMVKLYPPEKLTEGDWLEKNVKIGNKTIRKTVHGLSKKEIEILKKYNKSVLIKEGIPFVPAFLIALIFMVLFFVTAKSFQELFFSLF